LSGLAVLLAATLAIQVVDGDTLWIGEEKVRIANIDAPEIHEPKCDAERRLGLVAKRRLEILLKSGAVSWKRGDPKDGRLADRNGRALGTIAIDGRDVGEMLIAENLARPWTGKRQPWCNALP
jgi:endonuclease YncB( thermonuclease family)